jgi:hypothetical protein
MRRVNVERERGRGLPNPRRGALAEAAQNAARR